MPLARPHAAWCAAGFFPSLSNRRISFYHVTATRFFFFLFSQHFHFALLSGHERSRQHAARHEPTFEFRKSFAGGIAIDFLKMPPLARFFRANFYTGRDLRLNREGTRKTREAMVHIDANVPRTATMVREVPAGLVASLLAAGWFSHSSGHVKGAFARRLVVRQTVVAIYRPTWLRDGTFCRYTIFFKLKIHNNTLIKF